MTLRKRLFARFYDGMQRGYERLLGDRRQRLLAPVRGSVLELGPGTGINFLHYPRHERIARVESESFHARLPHICGVAVAGGRA